MSSISSDSMVGHILGYALYHDFVAVPAGTASHLADVKETLGTVMKYVLDNDFCVVDVDGRCTFWAQWAPAELNDDPVWYEERGVNSIMILGFLMAAFSVTGDKAFATAVCDLVQNHNYDVNMINQVRV